jgi:glycosyltransferase involved in cell wall biosynthesis
MSTPVASVIISTYNQPDWLERCLWGYRCQDRHDFELVIADDGSRDETRQRIAALRPLLPFPLQHVWHEDDGFRKCTILNKAIAAANSDYIIVSDGDCVPRADFVSQHLRLREPGRFLGGGYCKLPRATSHAIGREVIERGDHCRLSWLRAHGYPLKKMTLKLWTRPGWRERLLNATTPTPPLWAGNNASGWKADIERVNGFDERMTYGEEDLEMGDRLENSGVRGKQIRFSAVCVHLDHDRGYVDAGKRAANARLRAHTKQAKLVWTEHGLRKGPPPAAAA